MAGVVPRKRPTSGRKQWTLHEGPRSSLKRLRNQLANDGCPESQVVLAKQLLEEQCEYPVDQQENARLGVYWLIKASEQGNVEATEILKKCLETGKGISEHNYLDVQSCITMTQDEKIARKAAREMFASLSNGEEYITSEQLQRKMLAIDRDDKPRPENLMNNDISEYGEHVDDGLVNNYEDELEEQIDWSQRGERNEKLTEDHLVAAAINYAHGQLPIVNRILCLTDPNLHALDHIPLIQRPILHPFQALKILYYSLIKYLGQQPFCAFLSAAKTDLELVLLISIYSFVSMENAIHFFPMILYYLTFFAMIVTTFQMLQTKREFFDFRIWSGLFITYSAGSLNAEESEFQFIRNNLKPYGHFFIALLLNLMLYPIIAEQYLLQSELTILAFCLTFMTLFGFMYKKRSKTIYDILLLFSFAVNVLAKYPYETDPIVSQGWRFLDLKVPTFASYIIGNGIEFCINFRLLLYAFIPILFLKVAARENWRGIYMFLIPHCVTLSWLQLVIISSQGATMYGLLRGTLALVGVVLFLPLVGLTTVFLPAAALTKWLISTSFVFSFSIFMLFTILGLGICTLLAKSGYRKHIALFQIIFAVIAFYFLLNSIVDNKMLSNDFYVPTTIDKKTISYEQYQKYCYQHSWDIKNTAVSQVRCSKLDNLPIEWNGYVQDVRITSITNKWKYIIDKFPVSIQQYLYCLYGEEIKDNCEFDENIEDCNTFYDVVKAFSKCTLDVHNTYTFEILVRMQSSIWGSTGEVIIEASDSFKNFTLDLNHNDQIWFKGKLLNKNTAANGILGSHRPHIKLEEVGCLVCHNIELADVKISTQIGFDVHNAVQDFYLGIKSVLNFLLNPVVVLR